MTWPTVKLGDVCEAKSGFASGSKEETGIAQVRMNNVTRDGALVWNDVRRVPAPKNIEKLLLSPGDVLFNSTNSPNLVGKSAFFNGFDEPLTFSNHFLRLRARSDVLDGSFLARCLVDKFQRGTFEHLCKRWVNQAAVSRDDLFALEIPLPPLEEQKRLAAILDRTDELRRMRLQVLAGLDELAQSLFLELFGDPATNPKSWNVVRLGEVTQINPRLSSPLSLREEISFVPMACVLEEGRLEREEAREYAQVRTGFTPFLRGDILFAKITPCFENGKIAIATIEKQNGFGSTEFHVIRSVAEKADNYFLLFLLRQQRIRTEGERKMTGSAGQRRVPKYFLEALEIPLPPLALQQQFAQQIEELAAIKVRARASLTELNALFAALQARAFAGELSGAM